MLGKFIGKYKECLTDEKGAVVVSFVAEGFDRYAAKQCAAAAQTSLASGKERLKIEVDIDKPKRSLNANSYFHVLVDKIAKAMVLGVDEVKTKMVLEYGTVATEGGDVVIATLPKSANPNTYYPYAKWIGDFTAKNKRQYSQYVFYKQTHTLDRKEMSRLIDGVVNEAKELGIETRTPEELASLIENWEGFHEQKDKSAGVKPGSKKDSLQA